MTLSTKHTTMARDAPMDDLMARLCQKMRLKRAEWVWLYVVWRLNPYMYTSPSPLSFTIH